jgi:hypothetical protein
MEVQISDSYLRVMTNIEEFYNLHQKELLKEAFGGVGDDFFRTPSGQVVTCAQLDRDFDRGQRAARAGRSVPTTDMFHHTLTHTTTQGFKDLPYRSIYPRATVQTLRLLAFVAGMSSDIR